MNVALLTALSCALAHPAAALALPVRQGSGPPQPSGLAVAYRSGQSFITWTERADLSLEAYRVYRHDQPIDASNLAQATLLYQVAEGSSRFFADRYQQVAPMWVTRYLDYYVIEDYGRQLPADVGLLVWTLDPLDFAGATSGAGHYAVTTISSGGVENVTEFGPGNTFGPVSEMVDDPRPVRAGTFSKGLAHVYIQYMDLRGWNPTFHAPNPTNEYWGLSPFTHGVPGAIQYAYTYSIAFPDPSICLYPPPIKRPILIKLHVNGHNRYPPDIAPAPDCAVEIRPIDLTETWWFGFARDHDFRLSSTVGAGDVIVNYTEQRVLRMLYDLLRDPLLGPKLDPDRIYVSGHSMGGAGALSMGLRFPGVFSAAYASRAITNYETTGTSGGFNWVPELAIKWGDPSLNLPIESWAISGWADHLVQYDGTGVWDWQDHVAQVELRRGDEIVPIAVDQGMADLTIEWPTQGEPIYGAFNAADRCWGGAAQASGHTYGSLAGLPPTLAPGPLQQAFADWRVVRDESVPGLANASSDPPLPPTVEGRYNANIEWSASWDSWDGPPLDTAQEWRIALRTVDGSGETVDVTPRRLQAFQVVPGLLYRWENRRIADGVLLGSGTLPGDTDGLVTVEGLAVDPSGSRLSIVLDPADPQLSQVTALPPLVQANGIDAATVSVTVVDVDGNPLPGLTVALSATGTWNTIQQPRPTDALGMTQGSITSTQPEAKTITVTVNPGPAQVVLATQPIVQFVP
jgi:hypothetical protein